METSSKSNRNKAHFMFKKYRPTPLEVAGRDKSAVKRNLQRGRNNRLRGDDSKGGATSTFQNMDIISTLLSPKMVDPKPIKTNNWLGNV